MVGIATSGIGNVSGGVSRTTSIPDYRKGASNLGIVNYKQFDGMRDSWLVREGTRAFGGVCKAIDRRHTRSDVGLHVDMSDRGVRLRLAFIHGDVIKGPDQLPELFVTIVP